MSDPSFESTEPTAPGLVTAIVSPPIEAVAEQARRGDRSLGSGLRAWEFLFILALSTTAFLFWGGPLWNAPVGSSHVWRIGGSYLIVIPLVLAALARARRVSVGHLLGAVGIVWSAKMVITATLYAYVAPESATQYAPARTWEGPQEQDTARAGRQPMTAVRTDVGSGDVVGAVVASDDREPFPLAAVLVEDLPDSVFARQPTDVSIGIEHARYRQTVYVAGAQDRILLNNADASLHTLRVTHNRRAIANIPVPPRSAEHLVVTPPAGNYLLSCENHGSEQALLVVVDHPFFTLTDSNGGFELRGVPAGEHVIVVFRSGHVPFRRDITLRPNARLELSIENR